MSGKGSRPRPFNVTNDEYARRWDAIFGRDLNDQERKEDQEQVQKEKDPKNVVFQQQSVDKI